jgi:cell division protein FtsB
MPDAPWKTRAAIVMLLGLGATLLLVLFWGDYNATALWHLRQQKKELSSKIEELKVENQILTDQIEVLKDNPEVIEKVAREKLGMTGEGETVYRILPEKADSSVDSL